MNEENVLIDFHPNDYIIRLSPFLDEKGNWTGELMVGTISTEDNAMNDNDHYQYSKCHPYRPVNSFHSILWTHF